jgi:hypothetical protein
MFINYAENNVAYRFLVLKNDMLDCNTIIEAKNAKFFKYIYPLKKKNSHASVNNNKINETHIEKVNM